MSPLADAPEVFVEDRATWRAWLEANHDTSSGVWLVTWRTRSGKRRLAYEEAVEEALCFGWVDGTAGTIDEERGKQYFAPRKPNSGWAATNKARVERLIAEGLMAPAGLAAIERARANGSWELLDSVERLEVPSDLATALDAHPPAAANFAAFPPSVRKQLLTSLVMARRPGNAGGARPSDRRGRCAQRTNAGLIRPAVGESPNEGGRMNFNSILIGSDDAARLADYYTKLFGEPTWSDGGYTVWQLGSGAVTVGPHSEVSGRNPQPGRLIWNIESDDVQGEFERLKAAGAIVIREPYGFEGEPGALIATFADPDDNYFQLTTPMELPQG